MIIAKYGSKSYSCPCDCGDQREPAGVRNQELHAIRPSLWSQPTGLWDAVQERPDADRGGNVFKFRLARRGEGTSGGARAIVAMKAGHGVVLMYEFEKKDMGSIRPDKLRQFKASAKIYLGFSEEQMSDLVQKRVLIEIKSERS